MKDIIKAIGAIAAIIVGLAVGTLPSFFYLFGGLAFMKFLGLAFTGQ